MSEVELQDAILKHALELQRLSAHEEREAIKVMVELERELKQLLATMDWTDARKRELDALIKQARAAIDSRYAMIAGQVDTHTIMLTVAEKTVTAIEAFAMPSEAVLASLAKDILIDGAPSSAWWARQAEDTAFKFAAEVRQGVLLGEGNEKIVARIAGEEGFLDQSRRNVRALVHSSVQTAANRARLETYRKNFKHAAGVRWLATLDSRTCKQCMALDGSIWLFDGKDITTGKKVNGDPIDFRDAPAHWNCRCVLSPVPKSLDAIFGTTGIDKRIAEGRVRASKDGPTTATTMDAFLKRQSDEFVDEMLGPGRADLWRRGTITISDLVSGTGRELTLDELRARN